MSTANNKHHCDWLVCKQISHVILRAEKKPDKNEIDSVPNKLQRYACHSTRVCASARASGVNVSTGQD